MNRLTSAVFVFVTSVVMGCGGGGGSGTDPVTPEPPVIVSGPVASGITTGQATVSWVTDRPSTSVLRFGTTSAYGDSAVSGELVSDHSITVSGLSPLVTYHYRAASRDDEGLWVVSDDMTFTTLSPVGDLVDSGWAFFEQGELDSAEARFEEASSYEPANVEVLEGLGWTCFKLYRFGEARTALEQALSASPGRTDVMVGLALLAQAEGMHEEAVDLCRQALSAGGESYVFSHDAEITTYAIRYALVLALAALGRFDDALEEILVLDPSVDLDPEDATTWAGYDTFEEALLAVIEVLGDPVRML
jgi:hypothetical protein